jgi:DNA-binding MarR family transcriptional regulator
MTDSLTDRDYRAMLRFRFALRTFLAFSEQQAHAADLTPQQQQLLLAIRGHPSEAPSTSEVAEVLLLKVHSVVELVDRAEQAGLVSRAPDPRDARRQRLSLTPRGEELVARMTAIHLDELRRFRAELVEALDDLN